MSKFLENLESKIVGHKHPTDRFPALFVHRAIESTPMPYLLIYKFTAAWDINVSCHSKDIAAVIKNIKAEFKEAIYGDMRSKLIDIERAYYEHDRDKFLDALKAAYDEIDYP